jgi:spore germination protein YaaH
MQRRCYTETPIRRMHIVKRHISLFLIIPMFDKAGIHTLLSSDSVQSAMIGSMISACKRNGYDGFQLDFENIAWTATPSRPR